MTGATCTYCDQPWQPSCAEHQPVPWRMAPIRPASRFQPQTSAVRLAQALARKGRPQSLRGAVVSAPPAERIAEIRALMKDLDASPPARLTVSEASQLALVTNTLLAALDYVAERLPVLVELCTDFPCRHPDCIGTRELLTYIGAPQPARAQEGGAG